MDDDTYDDEAYAQAVTLLMEGIDDMLEAGASTADVRAEFDAIMRARE